MASRVAAAFERADDRLFAHYGEEAVLRSPPFVQVIRNEGVELIGEHGVVEQVVTTAWIRAADNPQAGDALVFENGDAFTLDFPLSAPAASKREWVLRPVP